MKKTMPAAALVLALCAPAFADSYFSLHIGGFPFVHHGRHVRTVVAYHHPPIVVQRPVVRVIHRPAGHWEWQDSRVWVPGYQEKVWVPPRYEVVFVPAYHDPHGNWIEGHHERRLVAEGYYRDEWRPGYYRIERRKVWVPY